VFADEAALRDLEGITHGAIKRRAVELESASAPDAVVVHDNPLLVEMGATELMDVVIVVDVPVEVQVARLIETRAMTQDEAQARIAAQATREQRAGVADIIVDNTGSLSELATIVGEIWDELSAGRRKSS